MTHQVALFIKLTQSFIFGVNSNRKLTLIRFFEEYIYSIISLVLYLKLDIQEIISQQRVK